MATSTTLARQLRNLAAPGLSEFREEQTGRRASILFDWREAATIGRGEIHALARAGLADLVAVNAAAFVEFSDTLFDEASLSFERGTTSGPNGDALVAATIERFLLRLSPYFLLGAAHKCLEWLVRAYAIHRHDATSLVECALPYYATRTFARVLRVVALDQQQQRRWAWLAASIRAGAPLARDAFVGHCAVTPATFEFVCNMIPRAVAAVAVATTTTMNNSLKTLCAFYASSIVGALDVVDVVGEETIGRLVPHLLVGLRSEWVDYAMASLMIVTQLASRVQLHEKVVVTISDVISKSSRVETGIEALACLAYLCESQTHCKLTKKAVRALCQRSFVLPHLQKLSASHDVGALIRLLGCRLMGLATSGLTGTEGSIEDMDVEELTNVYSDVFVKIVTTVKIDHETVVSLARSVLHRYLKVRRKMGAGDKNQLHVVMKPMIRCLATRHSSDFDVALEGHLKEVSGDSRGAAAAAADDDDDSGAEATASQSDEMLTWTQEFLALALGGLKHGTVISGSLGMTLTLSLHHPNVDVRRLAVLHLRTSLTEISQSEEIDVDFYRDSLRARLQDDAPSVVQCVLDIGEDLYGLIDPEKFLAPLCEIIEKQLDQSRCKHAEWRKVSLMAVEMLCSEKFLSAISSTSIVALFHCLLPHFVLLPKTSEFSFKVISAVARSQLPAKLPVLSLFPRLTSEREWINQMESRRPSDADLVSANVSLASTLAQGWMTCEKTNGLQLIGSLVRRYRKSSKRAPLRSIVLCVMDCLLREIDEEWGPLIHGIALELIYPEMLELSKLREEETKKDLGPFSRQDLETALRPLLSRKRLRGDVLKIAKAPLLFRVADAIKSSYVRFSAAEGKKWLDLSVSAPGIESVEVLLRCFDLIAEGSFGDVGSLKFCGEFRELMNEFLNEAFSDVKSLLQFFTLFWTTHPAIFLTSFVSRVLVDDEDGQIMRSLFSATTQIRSLKTTQAILKSLRDDDVKEILSQASSFVPALFVVLSSPVPLLRHSALACMRLVQEALNEREASSCRYYRLCCLVCENAAEIETDHNRVAQLVARESTSPSSSVLSCVLDVVVDVETPPNARVSLLETCRLVDCEAKLRLCLPLLKILLERHRKRSNCLSPVEYKCFILLLEAYTPPAASLLGSSPDARTVFLRVLQCGGGRELPSPRTCILKQVTKEFFRALPSGELQQQVFSKLLDFALIDDDADDVQAFKNVLLKIPFKTAHVVYELRKVTKEASSEGTPAKRLRSHVRSAASTGTVDEQAWQRALFVLELLQQRKRLHKPNSVISPLFDVLNRALHLSDGDNLRLDYAVQLVLSCLMNICQNQDVLLEGDFNVELIVECVRLSTNPQTHQHALVLLNAAASLFPDHVLHKIMPIFTFMGASLLRMDDNYSMQVVTKTVETVIPALLETKKKKGESALELAVSILRVFVDALPHIPRHRQSPVFEHLLATIGSEAHLHAAVVMLLEQCVVSSDKKTAPKFVDASPATQPFCVALIHGFSALHQAAALINLLRFVRELPEDKPQGRAVARFKKSGHLRRLFDVVANTSRDLRLFKVAAIEVVVKVLAGESFAVKVLALDSEEESKLASNYMLLLEETLTLISQTAKSVDAYVHDATANFWKAFLSKQYEIIEKLSALLSSKALIEITTQLLENENATVRRKAMDLFNNHLVSTKCRVGAEQVSALLEMMAKLLQTVKEDVQPIQNRQAALSGLTLLVRALAADNPEAFGEVATLCTDMVSREEVPYQLTASAIQCLSHMYGALGARLLSYLPRFLPGFMNCLQHSSVELLQLSAASGLLKVVEHYAKFLSPYLRRILKLVCHPSLCQEGQLSKVGEKVKSIRSAIAKSVPTRVMLPAVSDVYSADSDGSSIIALMSILCDAVSSMNRDDATTYSSQLASFFLKALDYRTLHKEINLNDVAWVEDSVIKSYVAYIVKLSENNLRPMYLRLFNWATKAGSPKDRALTFYRLSDSMAAKLMSLFTLFAGPLLSNAASLLDANNTIKTDASYFDDADEDSMETDQSRATQMSNILVFSILDCLHKTFLNASEGFVRKDIFLTLMQSLVDQIESMGRDDDDGQRVKGHLAPCISQLACAAKDRSQWKALNYQVLLKTRDRSSKVRLSALYVMQELYLKMGEEFVTLLPETIPFLAELMEDDSREVEMQCQVVIRSIEDLVGESIQSYLQS